MTEFVDKDIEGIKAVIVPLFHIFKNQAKIEKFKYRHGNIRKTQFKHLEIKLQCLRWKIYSLELISDWVAKKRKRTGELETIQIKHREKDTEKINRATVSYGTSSLGLCICNWSLLKDGWQEKYFNK